MPRQDFSDFIVYVDESGDHSLTSIDEHYPVFVLAFCIFYKEHYRTKIVPAIQKLKFDYFGHDLAILHEREIRKELGDFNIFTSKEDKDDFLQRLSDIIDQNNFVLAACVIEKQKEIHPYHFSLTHCLETLYEFVREKEQEEKLTFVAVESRGKKEDKELEIEFRRICDGENKFKKNLPFSIKIIAKTTNSTGLQLADLVARPIGQHILHPEQPNQAFDLLKEKFYCEGGRKKVGEGFDQRGLKHFPEA
ncbi:3-deoxy-D-manno-octulosonic acid transferase [Rodentibacter trehalosifermentans]|uniref:3-deoxy-D-manno-octulosonic acid transferase n=1 Tax=Rodentibacter trehalosifermentans TaxID=1908263 RepID=A0A1V3J0Q6_9PAST|nr:DUF3800 domain-containing protein [Rodentibacter trehalosifermentans]OOF46202.1 3-deoxy-D-manno-octulosonic acid transferase [Rodentibacter trehalosifermentans]OOF48507.1 3-deoxy-D-manno-octulosonic acid transferase [Rodentibacter trehalosifermentans]